MVVCVAIATGLGLWQYYAWHQHRADAARDLANDPPVALSTVMSGDSPFPGRSVDKPVKFTGHWVGDNIYVADRIHDGRRGYWVVTAAMVDGTESAMPVVRGWSPTPDASPAVGATSVVGWLQPTEGSGPPDDDPQDDVIPMMRIASLVEHVDADLYSGFVIARTIPHQQGLAHVQPAAQPGVSMFTGLRNLFYAVEWWVFGAFALFIWFRWCRDSQELEDRDEVVGDTTPEQAEGSEPRTTSA
jgi:cytochrome oxidase assembly protein ShyY1